jgi:hypothetical protein
MARPLMAIETAVRADVCDLTNPEGNGATELCEIVGQGWLSELINIVDILHLCG